MTSVWIGVQFELKWVVDFDFQSLSRNILIPRVFWRHYFPDISRSDRLWLTLVTPPTPTPCYHHDVTRTHKGSPQRSKQGHGIQMLIQECASIYEHLRASHWIALWGHWRLQLVSLLWRYMCRLLTRRLLPSRPKSNEKEKEKRYGSWIKGMQDWNRRDGMRGEEVSTCWSRGWCVGWTCTSRYRTVL